jgi:hypothetical protein
MYKKTVVDFYLENTKGFVCIGDQLRCCLEMFAKAHRQEHAHIQLEKMQNGNINQKKGPSEDRIEEGIDAKHITKCSI